MSIQSNLPFPEQPEPALKLSVELRALETRFRGERLRLADVFAVTEGRGYYVLMILCSLPFLTPLPTPMLSTAFGSVIFFTAIRLALGRRPWLPRWVLEKPLPAGFISRLLKAAARLLRWLETMLKPRLGFMHSTRTVERLGAGMIAFAAVLLMLPVPVPMTNFFPAAAILLLSAGAIERDGLCSLAGWVAMFVAAGFIGAIAFGGTAALNRLGQFMAAGA